MTEIERARQATRVAREILARSGASIGEIALSEQVGLEPWTSTLINVADFAGRTVVLYDEAYLGLALQVITSSVPVGQAQLVFNREDGISIDPSEERLFPFFPIKKVYLRVNPGASGTIKIRIYRDPQFLYTAEPQATNLGDVGILDVSDNPMTPLKEETFTARIGEVQAVPTQYTVLARLKDIYDTLFGGIKIKKSDGTVINPATDDTLAAGIKIKKSDGTVINPATEDTLAAGIKSKNAAGTVINPLTEETFSGRTGEVQDIPTTYTVLWRLRQLQLELGNEDAVTAGQVSVGTTAVNMHANLAIPEGFSVTIKALPGNTGIVYIGPSGVTTATGFPLKAGESVSLAVKNLNVVYAIADTASQGVAYIVEQ